MGKQQRLKHIMQTVSIHRRNIGLKITDFEFCYECRNFEEVEGKPLRANRNYLSVMRAAIPGT